MAYTLTRIPAQPASAPPTSNQSTVTSETPPLGLGSSPGDTLRTTKGSAQITITSSTSETTLIAAVAGKYIDVYGIIVNNTSATACKVTFKDATSGTTRLTVQVPATDSRTIMLTPASALAQTTVNNNWTATCGTSVASIEITALYVRN